MQPYFAFEHDISTDNKNFSITLQHFELMRNEHIWHLFLCLGPQVEQTI
jgi:hypothetical protein